MELRLSLFIYAFYILAGIALGSLSALYINLGPSEEIIFLILGGIGLPLIMSFLGMVLTTYSRKV